MTRRKDAAVEVEEAPAACLLCGAVTPTFVDPEDEEVLASFDLCGRCNSAFAGLARDLERAAEARSARLEVVAQVEGQLELVEDEEALLERLQLEEAAELVHLEVAGVVHAALPWGTDAIDLPACYSDTANKRLASRIRTYGSFGTVDRTAAPVSCKRCQA